MPVVPCPRCGRQIPVSADEVARGIRLECADCRTRFAVGGRQYSAPPPPPPEEPEDFAPNRPVEFAPVPTRSRAMPIVLGIVGGILLVLVVGATALALSGKKGDRKQPATSARPAPPPPVRPAPTFDPPPDFGPGQQQSALNHATAFGFDMFVLGFTCSLFVAYVTLVVLLLAWVARDARARAVDGGAVWVLIILLTGPIGFLVYLASRPHGVLVACKRCGNKRLMAATVCPHCGQVVAS